jgi:hypothetical protein
MRKFNTIKSTLYLFTVSLLLVFPNFSATDKERQKKSYAPLMRAIATPPSRSHGKILQDILDEWRLPKARPSSPTRDLPPVLEEKIRSKLAALYAINMHLIGRFEGSEKTPHMDPQDWATEKMATWKTNFSQAEEELESDDESLDDGIGGTPKTLYEYVIPLAKEELLELIKDNDELTKALALEAIS